jgi:hypothetical protein
MPAYAWRLLLEGDCAFGQFAFYDEDAGVLYVSFM